MKKTERKAETFEASDTFSRCHPMLNFFYFAVVLIFTMFSQHPLILAVSYAGAVSYGILLNGAGKTLRQSCFFTLPALLIVALLNPMFNHYGVTMLYYIESSGNWITLEAIVYGIVLGAVMFIVIQWFSCYNTVMTSDKFIYLFGRIIPAMSLMLSMALRFVPHFMAQLKVIRNGQKCVGMDVSNGKWFKKIRYALNMVSILVTWALENAIETADSMKSRGYGLRGRTAFSIYRFNRRDKLLGTMLVGLCVIFGYGCYRGAAFAQYNPRILLAGFTVFGRVPKQSCSPLLAAVTFVSFGVFCFLPLILDLCEESAMKKSRSHVQGEMAVTYRKIYEDMEGEAR